MHRSLTTLAIAFSALLSSGAAADTVSLRASASLAQGVAVRVADIADVQGESAVSTRDIVVLDAAAAAKRAGRDGVVSIELAEVRRALNGAKGVNVGRLALSGAAVQVRIGTANRQEPLQTQPPVIGASSLESVLPDALARWFGVEPDAIQVDMRTVDAKVLSTSVEGRTYAVSTSSRGEVLPVQARVFEGDTPVLTETIRVGIKLRKPGCVAVRDIQKGETLSTSDVRAEDVWVWTGSVPAKVTEVAGGIARVGIKAGAMVEDRQVDHPPTVRRGDLISVDCLSGSVMLRTTMRAKADGRAGDVIWLDPVAKSAARRQPVEKQDKVGGGPVRARIAGAGRAVLVAGEEDPGMGVAEEGQTPEDPGNTDKNRGKAAAASVGIVDVKRLATGH
ncbi:MAG: flagella basal body P-ring formation protein FlgA [Phycisphaerales bacterium]